MLRIAKFVFLCSIFTASILGQDTALEMKCSEIPVQAGANANFSVAVTPGNKNAAYNWVVTAGRVIKGQGTAAIEVETPTNYDGTLTAMVEVTGISANALAANCSTPVKVTKKVYIDAKPDLKINCPDSVITAGQKVVFEAMLRPKSERATYNWTVSWGTIVKGQGTPSIEVETPADGEGNLTATLEIGGNIYFESITDSCTVHVSIPPRARLLDEFAHSTQGYIKMMLDGTIFLELQNDPAAQGYIVIFPKTPREKAAIERIIRNQIKVRRFDATRITMIDGPKNVRSTIQFWIVPAGAEMPKPTLKASTGKQN
jgi:hypothetical protein